MLYPYVRQQNANSYCYDAFTEKINKHPSGQNAKESQAKLVSNVQNHTRKYWQEIPSILCKAIVIHLFNLDGNDYCSKESLPRSKFSNFSMFYSDKIFLIPKQATRYISIVASPFGSQEFAVTFTKKILQLTIIQVYAFSQKLRSQPVQKATEQQINRIIKSIIRNEQRYSYFKKPEILRFVLLRIYLLQLKGMKVQKDDILVAYDYLTDFRITFLSEVTGKTRENCWKFNWSQDQLQAIFQLYKQVGNNFLLIARQLLQIKEEEQKYHAKVVGRVLANILKRGFLIICKYLRKESSKQKQYEIKLCFTMKTMQNMVCKKDDQIFQKVVEVMSVGFGQKFTFNKIEQMFKFVTEEAERRPFYKYKRAAVRQPNKTGCIISQMIVSNKTSEFTLIGQSIIYPISNFSIKIIYIQYD